MFTQVIIFLLFFCVGPLLVEAHGQLPSCPPPLKSGPVIGYFTFLAQPGCAKLMFCLYFVFIILIFNDFVRPINSTSAGPILTKLAGLVEL